MKVKAVMDNAGIAGAHASAKGLRHGFAVNTAVNKVHLPLIKRWMGHSNPNMTARYMKVVDSELREIVCKTWTRQ